MRALQDGSFPWESIGAHYPITAAHPTLPITHTIHKAQNTRNTVRGLAFRADGFADPSTLFFTSEFSDERDGLFSAITTGLVSVLRVSAPEPNVDENITITANVAAGPGNLGDLTAWSHFWMAPLD